MSGLDPIGWLPVALALGSACLYGVSAVTSRRGMAHLEPQVAAIVSVGATALTFTLTSPLWMRAEDWFTPGFWVFALNGLIHPMLSVWFWMEAIQRAGPTVASTLTATAPLFATATAIAFLGETLSVQIGAGTLSVVAGIVVLSWGPLGVTRVMKIALVFATAAALVRGLNHTIGSFGLGLMPNPMMAGFVSASVAFAGSFVVYRLRHGHLPARVPLANLPYMALTGAIVCGGITCMYAALAVGDVVVVSPLIATYPLFTMLIALLLGMDVMSRRLVAGVVLVVAGIVAISLARG